MTIGVRVVISDRENNEASSVEAQEAQDILGILQTFQRALQAAGYRADELCMVTYGEEEDGSDDIHFYGDGEIITGSQIDAIKE